MMNDECGMMNEKKGMSNEKKRGGPNGPPLVL
jgi:hypothetical protein